MVLRIRKPGFTTADRTVNLPSGGVIRALDARLTSNSGVALGIFRILVGLMFAMHGTAKLFALSSARSGTLH